jgi:hypothetical protein
MLIKNLHVSGIPSLIHCRISVTLSACLLPNYCSDEEYVIVFDINKIYFEETLYTSLVLG